jgi:hypothetical protein
LYRLNHSSLTRPPPKGAGVCWYCR